MILLRFITMIKKVKHIKIFNDIELRDLYESDIEYKRLYR